MVGFRRPCRLCGEMFTKTGAEDTLCERCWNYQRKETQRLRRLKEYQNSQVSGETESSMPHEHKSVVQLGSHLSNSNENQKEVEFIRKGSLADIAIRKATQTLKQIQKTMKKKRRMKNDNNKSKEM